MDTASERILIFHDAEERIGRALHRRRMTSVVANIRKNPASHPLRTSLLKTELLPYQLDGVAFAAGAGRAVLADEMGLGKTTQSVGVAEFLAQNAGIARVLIVCPASLKSQSKAEIEKFSGRSVQLVADKLAEPERKIIIFSEWTTMLNLIEPLLKNLRAHFVRLDGSVPQAKRKQIVAEFQRDAKCRVFLSTNAGSIGLNLQAADTVINVELPWNPALLDQRIARAHRMGQKRKVHVYLLITERTIEEGLLATLGAKHELANAVLDPDSDLTEVELQSGTEALKRRLEILLGAQEAAPADLSVEQRARAEADALAERTARKERVAEAGGQILGAAFSFLGQLIPTAGEPNPAAAAALRERLGECVETGDDGRPRLTVTLPNAEALNALADALARLMKM